MTETALEQRQTTDGRRLLQLNNDEREAFAVREQTERAVMLFLDLTTGHTYPQIAAELEISVKQLKVLTRTALFEEIYNEHFEQLGHDPRLKVAEAKLGDLLPVAVAELQTLLTARATPAAVKMKAIERILEYNGVKPQKAGESSRRELADFLKDAGVGQTTIGEVHIHNPPANPAYDQAMARLEESVVEGEAREVPTPEVTAPAETPAANTDA